MTALSFFPHSNEFAPRTLEFFYFDAGGGHRSAAMALIRVITERYPHWQVNLISLQELLRRADLLYRLTNVECEDFYNGLLKRGMTYGSNALLRGLQQGIKARRPAIEELLRRHWEGQETPPDLVVSLIPNFNRPIFQALQTVYPGLPYVTVMTDIADHPPHFWMERQDQHIVCGSKKAARQARGMEYRPERVFQASGMILKPDFYRDPLADRRGEREKFGLDPDLPTALVMFGGHGSKAARKIVKRLQASDLKLQYIVMCGHNDRLRKKLEGRKSVLAVGFTDKVPDYMHLADFFIGKPGPGSISEALQTGLPVIVERNRRTMPQERYNAKWVEKHKVGIAIKSFKNIGEAVAQLLQDDGRMLAEFRHNAGLLNNRAVFEIPYIFERIMQEARTAERHVAAMPAGIAAAARKLAPVTLTGRLKQRVSAPRARL